MNGGAPPARPVTRVAVGVLVRADGAVLLADRPAGKPYAGYWEFPGGKIESGESIEQALARELAEELGVAVHSSLPWVTLEYDYPHAYVRLYFRRIHDWTGTPRSVEGQQLCFLDPGEPPPAPLLPAAVPAMRWIQLPAVTGFSPQTATSASAAVQWLENVLLRGMRQVIWHEPLLDPADGAAALAACSALAAAHGARLLVDSRSERNFLQSAGREDVHHPAVGGRYLCAAELRGCEERGSANWLGAAVEEPADLAHAALLGCDFAVLEPAPASPDAPGRRKDKALFTAAPLPVYVTAQTGLANLRAAQALGAQGLAIHDT